MTFFDIFNGDADGLCALHQLRLSDPRTSVLITGVKRDTALVGRAQAVRGDHLTVLDVGLERNRAALDKALAAGASCVYFDHHFAGDIPQHALLQAHIRVEPYVCTSLLVDEFLQGQHRLWALTAAFGDGLGTLAERHCRALALSAADTNLLRELGEALNYNAYGESLEDLHFNPIALYERIRPFPDPRAFAAENPAFRTLRDGYQRDLALAAGQAPVLSSSTHYVLTLPDEPWSRRINGVLASRLAQDHPARAHAILVPTKGGYSVSVRAPAVNPIGAEAFCGGFASGGGRSGAGGINLLPSDDLNRFLRAFEGAFLCASLSILPP